MPASKRPVQKPAQTVNKTSFLNTFLHWLPLAFTTTMVCGLIYGAVQQNYRQSANDPQIELATNLVQTLQQGNSPDQINVSQKQDLSMTLSPFFIIYDNKGKAVASSISLNSKIPVVPKGALDSARTTGENRITWEPAAGVRDAIVIKPFKSASNSGSVVVGRSLTEVEKREKALFNAVAGVWLLTLLGSLLIKYLVHHYPALLKKRT